MTIEFDATRFNQQMAAVHDALIGAGQAGDASTIVQDSARLLLKQAIKFTPPKTQGQGNTAVTRDIYRSMSIPTPDFFRNDRLKAIVNKTLKSSDAEALQAVLRNSQGWKKWEVKPYSDNLHKSVRDSRGRVQKSKNVFVLERGMHRARIVKIKKRVGSMKAAWRPAFQVVGGKVAGWISRHQRPYGYATASIIGTEKPFIIINNHARGIGLFKRQFNEALRARSEAMAKRVRLILSGYAKDVAAGIRVSRKARLQESPNAS